MKNTSQETEQIPVFRWTETYSVNVAALDHQHQGLFNIINELNAALAVGQGAAATESVLHSLLQYAATHFTTEEALMEKHHFSGLVAHRNEHQAFAQKVANYLKDFKDAKVGTPVLLLLFLQSWLKDHILKSDKAYTRFLNEHGVR
ncbi:MAG: bacteriohemerythrin [Terriglobales bacterium]|jgi:hemerythrin